MQPPRSSPDGQLSIMHSVASSSQPTLQEFLDDIQTHMTPILPTPTTRRRRLELPPNFTPRRSDHIAKTDHGLNSEAKAKRVLLRCLGIISDDEAVSEEALQRYHKLFERPLAGDIVQAFADFYGWNVPTNIADLLAPEPPLAQYCLVEV